MTDCCLKETNSLLQLEAAGDTEKAGDEEEAVGVMLMEMKGGFIRYLSGNASGSSFQ